MTLLTGSPSQQKATALAPKVPALLSFLGSSYIATSALRKRKWLSSTNHRLLLGMSACDMITSVWSFMSSWAVPVGTWWQAAGNDRTCKTQAFVFSLNLASVFYGGSLGLYYFLVVRQGWNKQRINKIEPFLHAVPLFMGLVPPVIIILGLGMYMSYGAVCAQSSPAINTIDNLLSIVVGIFVTVLMFMMYWSIRKQEKAMISYDHQSSSLLASASDQRKKFQKSRMVAIQGIAYCIPFYITWSPGLVFSMVSLFKVPPIYEVAMWVLILEPAQGFFNFLVYIRPSFIQYCRSKRKEAAARKAARKPSAIVAESEENELELPPGDNSESGSVFDINDADDVNGV